jgi:hypothetical protein
MVYDVAQGMSMTWHGWRNEDYRGWMAYGVAWMALFKCYENVGLFCIYATIFREAYTVIIWSLGQVLELFWKVSIECIGPLFLSLYIGVSWALNILTTVTISIYLCLMELTTDGAVLGCTIDGLGRSTRHVNDVAWMTEWQDYRGRMAYGVAWMALFKCYENVLFCVWKCHVFNLVLAQFLFGTVFVWFGEGSRNNNENSFARAFGGDSGTCVCRGKVTSRLSPCFAGSWGFFSLLFLARRIR